MTNTLLHQKGIADVDYWLYDSVPNLTPEERRMRVEQAYLEALQNLGNRYMSLRARLYMLALEKGQVLPFDVVSKMHQEQFASGMDAEAREICTQHYLLASRLGMIEAYKRDYAQAFLEGMEIIPKRMMPYKEWMVNPSTLQILSNKEGYSGNFYSWFFKVSEFRYIAKSKDLDTIFFQTMQEGLEKGLSENKIIKSLHNKVKCDVLTQARLKNVVRTETVRAMEQGKIQESRRLGIVQAYRFIAVQDCRSSKYCLPRHNLIISINDPLLDANCPPIHYMCRSTLQPISRRQLERLGGEERLASDKVKLLACPVFDWHGNLTDADFREATLP